ncbi:MAG: lipopolysaccharide biosynthesis protein [Terriglobales bacterium]
MASPSRALPESRPSAFDPAAASGRAALPLRVGFTWSLFGWAGYAACQWLMLSVMAKLGSAEVIGQFAYALAICAPLFMLTNLQLRGVQSTDALSEYCFSDYLTLRLLGSTAAVLLVVAVCPFLGLPRAALCALLLVAAFKSLESFSDVIAGLMQKFEMLDSVAISLLLRGSIGIGAFGLCFALCRNLPLALLLWIGAVAAVLARYDLRVARRLARFEGGMAFRFNWRRLGTLVLTSLPLGLVSAIASLGANIPRYAIRHALSVAELGIFASIAYPVTATTVVANSLGQSALARLSRLFADGRIGEFRQLVLKLVAFGAAIAFVALLLVSAGGNWLLSVLYTPEYARQGSLFQLLALTAGLNAIGCFLFYALSAARQFKVQLAISLASLLTTFVCSTLWVPRWRLIGAALAMLCAAAVAIAAAGAILGLTIAQHKPRPLAAALPIL